MAAFKPLTVPDSTFPPSRVATWVAGIGLAMLAVTAGAVTLEWFGIPSLFPEVPLAGDPYAIDVGYGGLAIGLLLLSVTIRFVTGAFSARARQRKEPAPPAPAAPLAKSATAVGAGVGLLVVALVFASCGSAGSVSPGLLSEAAQAGSVAPTILGSSLDDARLQRAARQPGLCISDYTTALQQFPGLLTAYVGRGDCYLNGGQNGAAAVHDYTAAIQLSPLQADLYLRRAVAYRVIGNLTAAIADYRTAALNPSATAGELLTAVDGLVAVSDYQDAQGVYNRALVIDPQSSLLYVAGGDLATALGSDQRAAADYANALALPGAQVALCAGPRVPRRGAAAQLFAMR